MSTSRRPRVVYWNNIPSPYIVDRFNVLADRGQLDFEAWFSARTESDRSWDVDETTWRFRHRYVPVRRVGGSEIGFPPQLLGPRPPDLLVTLHFEPSFIGGLLAARRRGARTAIWLEVTFSSWVPRRWWKERIKRWLFPRLDGIFAAGTDARAYALRYDAEPARIWLVPHGTDVRHFSTGRIAVQATRERRRAELGLRGVTFLYVGRLWSKKGVVYLLRAFSRLQRCLDQEISLLLVGDGVDERELRATSAALGLRNVVFAGFKQKPELPAWYALADVFVFPSLGDPYGLVVDEAMACSLPVISTTTAGEIGSRLADGIDGYLVPPRDSSALFRRMAALAGDPGLRLRMGRHGFERMRGDSPATWSTAFERAVSALLERRAAGGVGLGR
jgi:glycosyltransferase involved in cell wall biosynthesis